MDRADFAALVARAGLAPSVHNVQPARWRREGDAILVGADLAVALAASDPEGRDAGLSCGAAIEALVLALGARGRGGEVADLWALDDRTGLPGTRLAARITVTGVAARDPLEAALDHRFTWRGGFVPEGVSDWMPQDAVLVQGAADKQWLAARHDAASLAVMRDGAMRAELLHWMRLSDRHKRAGIDGMDRRALRMSRPVAWAAGLALGPLWGLCDRLGLTPAMTAEAGRTVSAAAIALFHRSVGESPVTSGRAYLRLWLEATGRGWAGWPMAALGDDPVQAAAVGARFGIGSDRRIVQVIRFGRPSGAGPGAGPGAMPQRARRPVGEVIL